MENEVYECIASSILLYSVFIPTPSGPEATMADELIHKYFTEGHSNGLTGKQAQHFNESWLGKINRNSIYRDPFPQSEKDIAIFPGTTR